MLCLLSLSLTSPSSLPFCLRLTGDKLGGEEESEGAAVTVVSGASLPTPDPNATVETPFWWAKPLEFSRLTAKGFGEAPLIGDGPRMSGCGRTITGEWSPFPSWGEWSDGGRAPDRLVVIECLL